MKKIAIVTDSTSDLSIEQMEEYNIEMLPLRVIYREKEYRDRLDITPQQIYDNLEKEVPKSSLPLPGDVIRLLDRLKEEGYTDVVISLISSGLSGTYNMVRQVAESYSGLNIEVVDSKSLSFGLGFLSIEAAKERARSNDLEKIMEKIRKTKESQYLTFVVKTLEYLKLGGRIGLVEGTMGEMLGIKPIIGINDNGVYYTISKVRGRKRSINKMFELMKAKYAGKSFNLAVISADADEEALKLMDKIREIGKVEESFFAQLGPVMGVYTGPGLIGIVAYEV
ncbi:MAG: fatty acid-binding protein DegV [Clostridiales bacterium]|nr:MAG: fatty acid-binding protein DegV [Clostridiales bacterium]